MFSIVDQLIQALFNNRAVTLPSTLIPKASPGVYPSMSTRKRTDVPREALPMTRMQIAGVKAVRDAPVGLLQHNGLVLHIP